MCSRRGFKEAVATVLKCCTAARDNIDDSSTRSRGKYPSGALCAPGQHTATRRRKCARQSRSCLQRCQIFADFIFFTHRLSNKPFLIWLLTTPPHLKYAATLPCNLSLWACFADINVSQGSIAKYVTCDRIFNIHLTANLQGNLPVKIF